MLSYLCCSVPLTEREIFFWRGAGQFKGSKNIQLIYSSCESEMYSWSKKSLNMTNRLNSSPRKYMCPHLQCMEQIWWCVVELIASCLTAKLPNKQPQPLCTVEGHSFHNNASSKFPFCSFYKVWGGCGVLHIHTVYLNYYFFTFSWIWNVV